MDRFHYVFQQIDLGGTGSFGLQEFLEYFNILEPTPFHKQTFAVLDKKKSGAIDFLEFVACIYSYGTYSWEGLCKYAFDVYDDDKNGELDTIEIEKLVSYVHGENKGGGKTGSKAGGSRHNWEGQSAKQTVGKIMAKMDHDRSGTIRLEC